MYLHILGASGTFMGGIALIARELGHEVTGVDAGAYPPMSTLLSEQGVSLTEGYTGELPDPPPDCILIGNALSRGNPTVEATMTSGLDYQSGPAWLSREVLSTRTVIAVAGTHGKSTTSAMLAHLLDRCGQQPGFLIGAVPSTFSVSARCGRGKHFVIEADEYDSAFFDKRPKFVHYHPHVAILNNLEFDHGDIYSSVEDIIRQFHYLVRTVSANGTLIVNQADTNLARAIEMGCWSQLEWFDARAGADALWTVCPRTRDCSEFSVCYQGNTEGQIVWPLFGQHNMANALSAIAAANAVGVKPADACTALSSFIPPQRRLQHLGDHNGLSVYDDFAHHPTAITATLDALRQKHPRQCLMVVLEARSNTMKLGHHLGQLGQALSAADRVIIWRRPDLTWDPAELAIPNDSTTLEVCNSVEDILGLVHTTTRPGDQIVLMSNGDFDGLAARLINQLSVAH